MSNLDLPVDPAGLPNKRRRRRRDFQEALQQTQADSRLLLADIGKRLRDLRSARGLSIRDLARKSGLNVNTLSMIENGKNLPSLETLQKLSLTLEIPITAFFEDKTPENKIAHYKASQRRSVLFTHGKLEDLGDGIPRRGVEIFLVMLSPHSNSGENLMVHTGREMVYCLEGHLTYTIEDQTFLLEPGDSLFFEAHLPHRWQNNGATPTRSLLVLCPADEQDRPTERHFKSEPASVDET
jgi:transcriptional regulator with XRE-family HTH domain